MGVSVKSIPFEGILTSRRIILVDRAKNILPPKEIPLATIKTAEPGENANRGPTLSLAVMAKTGDTRQMILTFSRSGERDEWARIIRESASPSFEQVIRKVIPGADQAPRKTTTPPRIEVVNTPVEQRIPVKRAAEGIPLSRKIIETGTAGAQAPAPAPAVKEFDASSLGENLFCNRCGNRVSTDSAFCNRCGAPVVPPEAPAPRPAAPRQYAPAPAPEPAYEQPTTPDAQLRQSLSWDEEQGADTMPAARVPAQKAAKKGILSGVFGSKKQRETPPAKPRSEPAAARPAKQGLLSGIFGSKKPGKAVPPEAAAAPRPRRESRSILSKKGLLAIVAVIVVVLVIAVGALFVYPTLTSGNLIPSPGTSTAGNTGTASGSPAASALTADKVVVKETTRPVIPATGVFVSVDYLGSWKGTYGMPSDLQTAADSGARYYEVVNATGQVTAVFEKKDSSTKHDLTVEIYRNGAVVATGKTGTAFGKVTVSAVVTNGTAPAASATTAAPVAGNISVTTKATTAAATVKTTAPAANTTTASK